MSSYTIAVIFIVVSYFVGFFIGRIWNKKDIPVIGTIWVYESAKEVWFSLNEDELEVEHDGSAKVLIKIVPDDKQK